MTNKLPEDYQKMSVADVPRTEDTEDVDESCGKGGVCPGSDRKYLFVIDGSKAWRARDCSRLWPRERGAALPQSHAGTRPQVPAPGARNLASLTLSGLDVIESPKGGCGLRTRRVCRWRDGKMVLRWAAAALLMTEQNFRKIRGYRDLWVVKAALGRNEERSKEKVA